MAEGHRRLAEEVAQGVLLDDPAKRKVGRESPKKEEQIEYGERARQKE